METATLDNTNSNETQSQVSDVEIFGNINLFQLICKISSTSEGYSEITKAMQTPEGCIIQVTTQYCGSMSVSLTFVPNAIICYDKEGNKYIGSKQP